VGRTKSIYTLYNIAGIIKVCIIALENADTGFDTHLPNFTLTYNCFGAYSAIAPVRGVECLEEIKRLMVYLMILPKKKKLITVEDIKEFVLA